MNEEPEHPETLTSSTNLPLNLGAWLKAGAERSDIGQPERADAASRILQAADAVLAEGEALLQGVTPEAYNRPCPTSRRPTVGDCFRDGLEPFLNLARAFDDRLVDYAACESGDRLAKDPGYTLQAYGELRRKLHHVTAAELHRSIAARCLLDRRASAHSVMASTFGRELAHCVALAIQQHNFISALLAPDLSDAPTTSSATRSVQPSAPTGKT